MDSWDCWRESWEAFSSVVRDCKSIHCEDQGAGDENDEGGPNALQKAGSWELMGLSACAGAVTESIHRSQRWIPAFANACVPCNQAKATAPERVTLCHQISGPIGYSH